MKIEELVLDKVNWKVLAACANFKPIGVSLDSIVPSLRNGMHVRIGVLMLAEAATRYDAIGSSDNFKHNPEDGNPLKAACLLYEAVVILCTWQATVLK